MPLRYVVGYMRFQGESIVRIEKYQDVIIQGCNAKLIDERGSTRVMQRFGSTF